MSEWGVTSLGSLFALDNTKLGAHAEEPTVMSLSKYDGFVRADEYFDKRIASSKLDGYKVVQPGEWAFSTIHINEGSIARNNIGERGVISPMYTTMNFVANDCIPEYAELIVRQPELLAEYSRRAQGSVNRRRSLPFKEFAKIEVSIPPLAEQRRIVDVMTVVDAQIQALEEEAQRTSSALARLNSDLIEVLPTSRPLGDFTATRSGPSYSAADVSPTFSSDSVPVIGIPNTKPDGSIDLSEIGYVAGLPESVGRIDGSSLVLIRTNGNRQRIGNVYIPPAAAHDHAVSAFQFLMKVDNPSDREFVYWLLREPSMQAEMSQAASGTTGLGNLAVRWLNAVRVPWSDDSVMRASIVAPLRSLQDSINASTEELSRLRSSRSALLTSFLTQEIEIPESYDSLCEFEEAS